VLILIYIGYKENIMVNKEKEIVCGLTSADVKKIADQVFSKTDGNHPQLSASGNGFIDILQHGKSNLSSSAAFVRKVQL